MSKPHIDWIPFRKQDGSRQVLPTERDIVVVVLEDRQKGCEINGIAVGWFRYAAGDKESPHFVIPDIGGEVVGWVSLASIADLDFKNWPRLQKNPPTYQHPYGQGYMTVEEQDASHLTGRIPLSDTPRRFP